MADGALTVVGLVGGECFGRAAANAIATATVVVGSPRQLAGIRIPAGAATVELTGPLDLVLDAIAHQVAAAARVCVLASGDPGFFGIVRALGARFGSDAISVHPAPSSVSLAFARLGLSWDQATVVSAHGRPLADAVNAALRTPTVAVLTAPDAPPQRLAQILIDAGIGARQVGVVTRIGEPGETVTRGDLPSIASGTFDPMSIVILTTPDPIDTGPGLAWGLPEAAFEHRDRMITKSEVRAVALGKLALPSTGVLWDLGAGSGSVAIECARLRPGLRVIAVERNAEDARRIEANASRHGAHVDVIEGTAPDVCADLPDPDRVFIGGGGTDVLDAVLARLRPGGVIVANYAMLDRAAVAHQRLGNLSEITVSRGVSVGDLGVRLAAENPVFVCWGPSEQ